MHIFYAVPSLNAYHIPHFGTMSGLQTYSGGGDRKKSDYRPVNLINYSFKLITDELSERVKVVMEKMIDVHSLKVNI